MSGFSNTPVSALSAPPESIREAGSELGRDIEATVVASDRSNAVEVQAIKAQEEDIPSAPLFVNANTSILAYRRVQISKFNVTSQTPADTPLLMDLDPFLAFYNATLNHNSSMSTFHDIKFDVEIDVVIQSLPTVAGILHFVFDRFGGTANVQAQLFAYPIQMVDLSAKDSLNFTIAMDLPTRVMNTVRTPFAGMGNGMLKCYLATPCIVPDGLVQPVTITVFARAVNVTPFNLKTRSSVRLETSLTALDNSVVQSMCDRGVATNNMRAVEIASHFGFHERVPIANDRAVGDELISIDLHPMEKATPLSAVCAAYSYFRGSLRVKLTVNLSKLQNITLAAVFVPCDTAFDASVYESFAFTEIMFDEKHEATLTVNYSNGSNWLPLFVAQDSHDRAMFGSLVIILRSPIVSTVPYGTAPTLLVQTAAGPDFEVAHPRDFGKNFSQPALLEMNPEVPRTFMAPSTNLYADARLPVFYTRIELSHIPKMLPVTCTRGNAGVLGMLKNTHAAWSGSIDYIFVFEGHGQCEIRYDPTRRVVGNRSVLSSPSMPTAGYVKLVNSLSNPSAHITVPFCSLYDYLPTRASGVMRTLNNSNCNGCLFIAGKGNLRIYRAAGADFKVHFYNSFDDAMINSTTGEAAATVVSEILDPVESPLVSTVPYVPGRLEAGFLGVNVDAFNNTVANADMTISDIRQMVPEIRRLLEAGNAACDTATSVTDSMCTLLSGPSAFAKALLKVVSGGVSTLKQVILSLHGTVTAVLGVVTPEYILRFCKSAFLDSWTEDELALIYVVALVCGCMSLGVESTEKVLLVIAMVGLSIPLISGAVSRMVERLVDGFSASAAKEMSARLEAPSPLACCASLLMSVISFFIPSKKFDLHGSANFGKDIAGVFTGAKAVDEMLSGVFELILNIPGIESVIGSGYKDMVLLSKVDVEDYVREVKDILATDFYNTALTNEKVRQQEKLWKTHKLLDQHLPTLSKSNFFFNSALKKVMDEQLKMYKHSQTFKGSGRERFPPFIFMIGGETRVGKSHMTAELMRMICKMMNWDHDTDIYTRSPADPYFSGLAQQKIFYGDDLHTNITANGADSDMAMVMSFATNAPWAPRMAAMEDKGRNVPCLLGMFCTNTLGEPSSPGIRNVPAYLARRHLAVQMRWREGVTVGDYQDDFSHAEFVLVNPHDREAKQFLDANFQVARSPAHVKVYDFTELWKLLSTKFVHHLIRERRVRHARRIAGQECELPAPELLDVARELADHYDDVDFVDVSRVQAVRLETLSTSQLNTLGGENATYASVLSACSDIELSRAVGDIVYVKMTDSFVWRGKFEENLPLYSRLLAVAGKTETVECETFEPLAEQVAEYSDVLCDLSEEESVEFYECIPVMYHDLVRRSVERRREAVKLAETMGVVGKRSFAELVSAMYNKTPRWIVVLLSAFSLGGAVYFGVKQLRKLFGADQTIEEEVMKRAAHFGAPEYAAELMPATAMPLKKTFVAPVQYASELMPATAMPLKKPLVVPAPQYANELMPAMAMLPKHTVIPDPLEDDSVGRVVLSYHENPRATQSRTTQVVTLESTKQIETCIDIYRYGRFGKIAREGADLHFLWLDNETIYVNRHFWTVIGGTKPGTVITLIWNEETGPKVYKFAFAVASVRALANTDHSIYMLPKCVEGIKSNWRLLATEAELTSVYPTVGVLLSFSSRMDFSHQRLSCVSRRVAGMSLPVAVNLDGTEGERNHTTVFLDGFQYPSSSGGGYCGSLMILPHSGGKIFGTHVATLLAGEDTGNGISQYICKEMLESCMNSTEPLLPEIVGQYEPAPVYTRRDHALTAILRLESGMGTILKTAVGVYEPMIDMTPYGLKVVNVTHPGFATTGSMFTSYRQSPISKFFPDATFRVPAVLRPGDRRCPYEYDPRPDIMGKYNKVIVPLPADVLEMIVEHLSVQFSALHHPCRPTDLLDFETAVNGIPDAPYFDAINFHTSPGLPYSLEGMHRKSSCFTESGVYPNGMPRRVCSYPKVEERYNLIVDSAKKGEMVPDVIFQEFMKDELLKRAKVFVKPATRGIANPPLDLLLAVRAAFLPFIALLQYNRHRHDCQVGINPMSGTEWSEMLHRLKSNSDMVFDADYTAFDSTTHGNTLDAFADICNNVMGGTFQTQMARKTLVRYAYDRVSQVTNVQVKINQGMASGMPITAVGNSVVNMIYLRAAWILLARQSAPEYESLDHFDKNVKAIVYGDDNMVTVKAQVSKWYNLREIALVLEPFGILMTDGAKNERHLTQPFSTWDQVRFLKRAFVYDDATGNYLSPLDKKTIIDRVRYVKAKAWLPDMEMRIEMSLLDCVFHGRKYFEAFKYFVNSVMTELRLPVFTVSFDVEMKKWQAAGTLVRMEAGNEITFARTRITGDAEVFYAQQTAEPTRIGGRWSLALSGPRPAVGDEASPIGIWKTQLGGTSPPTTTGGVTFEQLVAELDRRPTPATFNQIRDHLAAIPRGISVIQLQEELNNRPVPVTLAQLRAELAVSRPPPPPPPPTVIITELPLDIRTTRKEYVKRSDLDNYSYNSGVFSGWTQFQKDQILINRGMNPGGWRHPMWLVRDQFVMFGNYIVGLEEVPVPYAGGFADFATFSRNQLKIRAFLASLGVKGLNYDRADRLQPPISTVGDFSSAPLDDMRPIPSGSFVSGDGTIVDASGRPVFVDQARRRFSVKYGPQAGDELGNYRLNGDMAAQKDKMLATFPNHFVAETINGRTYYRITRGTGDWMWVILHWNLVNILMDLGARNPIRGTGQSGRYEWSTLSENIINIADALFVRRRQPHIRVRNDGYSSD